MIASGLQPPHSEACLDKSQVDKRPTYRDRSDAGNALAGALAALSLRNPVVLAIPRGGVVVGEQVRLRLGCPLFVLVAQKIAAPGYPELSMGAIAEGRVKVIDPVVRRLLAVSDTELRHSVEVARLEQRRRAARYRAFRHEGSLAGHAVVLVDDGIASGATVRAAIQAIRLRHADAMVLAAPVASSHAIRALRPLVDTIVVPCMPADFRVVSLSYAAFDPVAEAQVLRVLSGSSDELSDKPAAGRRASAPHAPTRGELRQIPVAGGVVGAEWTVPDNPWAIALFAHGSGSNRDSTRNRCIARTLQRAGVATLLMDFLTQDEALSSGGSLLAFDLNLLAGRLRHAGSWLRQQAAGAGLPLVIIGSSVGAAAAVRAQHRFPDLAQALVCRSGRLDMVSDEAGLIGVPTLLVTGQDDGELVAINRTVRNLLVRTGRHCMVTLPGVTHRFEEPGALTQFSTVTRNWLRGVFRVA